MSTSPHLTAQLPPLALVLLLFVGSLIITMGASNWFSRRLETVSDLFDLSPSLLSLLGALGANIPNYAASIIAIAGGQVAVGLGIIVGSNIYNIAIILSISTFATGERSGIVLPTRAARDVQTVALYALAIMSTTLITVWLLSGMPPGVSVRLSSQGVLALIGVGLLTLGVFGGLAYHALQRVPHAHHPSPDSVLPPLANDGQATANQKAPSRLMTMRYTGEIVIALLIALGGVSVMVQYGQVLALELHISQVILGLLILAVATSLPNTVVAFSLARTRHAIACVEEVFSSNSINAAFGIALPLLFWHALLHDQLLLLLDTPLMVILTVGALWCVSRRRISHAVAILLLLVYSAWVVGHLVLAR
ncbi:MAG: hypothetical protein M3Z08_10275 [Chloroflexota bacterium]|nr:hypothetical protein [Chloroflexota bacterium]